MRDCFTSIWDLLKENSRRSIVGRPNKVTQLDSDFKYVQIKTLPLLSIQIRYWAETLHLSLLREPVPHLTLS